MAEEAEKGTESAEKAYATAAAEAKPAKASAPESNKLPRKPAAKAAPKKAVVKPKPAKPAVKPASAPAQAETAEPALPVVEAAAAPVAIAETPDAEVPGAEAAVAETPVVPVTAVEAPEPEAPAAAAPEPVVTPILTVTELKEKIMASAKTADFTKPVADAFGEIQTRAQAAYEKGTEAVSEITEFTKGNVEAIVESGKILAGGVQDLGKTYVEEAKSAYETLTGDIKEAAAVKSPTELFQLQGKIFRRNFDSLVAASSKNTEAWVKLANDAFAPLSGRVNLAAEKISKAA